MELRRIDDFLWEVPIGYVDGMRVPGRIFGTESLISKAVEDRAVEQVANVATLPGIVTASFAMPDIHWGYGFPIGGVAATDATSGGAVSPGGVGFDIGCGVRLIRSDLTWEETQPRIRDLVNMLSRRVPRGVGGKGRMQLDNDGLEKTLKHGVAYPLSQGVGWEEDAELCEDSGALPNAVPALVSERARERGASQLGSLGGGNHFLEVQVVDEIRDRIAGDAMRLSEGQVVVMIHSGSRGIGHQTCQDYVRTLDRVAGELKIDVPDRQLACAPIEHKIAQDYLGAMDAAGNFARANRHVLADAARESFAGTFGRGSRDLGMHLVYDISHNLAKIEEHTVDGKQRSVCVHRKGATPAFAPGHPAVPDLYKDIGQPVIIPGSMGTASFVLVGAEGAAVKSFASTCHGAGRAMSRGQAKKQMSGQDVKRDLQDQGIIVSAGKAKLLSEEAPYAYKDVSQVVEACEGAGLTKVVARLRPVGVVKG
ncbi:MAG: RtcB family protein [Actinomycetota bacterium]|nr:RtcB family protein [Actinomycetota bacterium]